MNDYYRFNIIKPFNHALKILIFKVYVDKTNQIVRIPDNYRNC